MAKVMCYYNLHKHMWSIKALEGPQKGRVIGHSDTVLLANAQGKVSEAGRQRVLKEQRRNVHAGITGELVHTGVEGYFPGIEVTYNPYKYATFVDRDTEAVYGGSEFAYMAHRRVYTL